MRSKAVERAAGPAPPARIEVVAAALLHADGRVLVAQRPPGKAFAGRWEFPGGKLGLGETQGAGLCRELSEELGIRVLRHHYVMSIEHEYPDRRVILHFHIVDAFVGEPRGMDQQALQWVALDQLGTLDMLEADRPFIAALQDLPRIALAGSA